MFVFQIKIWFQNRRSKMKKESAASSSSSGHVGGKSKSQKKRKCRDEEEENGVSSQQTQLQAITPNGSSVATPGGPNSVAALMADVRDNMPTYRLPPFHSTLPSHSLFSPLAATSSASSALTPASKLLGYNTTGDFNSPLHHTSTHHPGHPSVTPQSQLVGIFSGDYFSTLQHQFASGSPHLLGPPPHSTGHFSQQQQSQLQSNQQLQSPAQQLQPHGETQQQSQLFRGLASPLPNRLFASQGVHSHYSPSLPSFGSATSYTNLLSGFQPSDAGVVGSSLFQIDSSPAGGAYFSNWYSGQSARPTL